MSNLNKDGLIPGQQVDMNTILRVNRERADREVIANDKPAAKRSNRKAKAVKADNE